MGLEWSKINMRENGQLTGFLFSLGWVGCRFRFISCRLTPISIVFLRK